MMEFVINARGHPNVRSEHGTTFEVTMENHLTPRGDCIIAVDADKAMEELPEEFKRHLKDDDAVLEIRVECNGLSEVIRASGSRNLILSHPTDLVVRKSGFIDGRTLAIKAGKAACDFDRALVRELQKGAPVRVTLILS
ncbi:MAG: DUF371 domain-containing protein [Candidatus Altiarchaeota archaeon]|nr:DUF371 domain-containing protein [Candidatus Altiarchaeota archaeon]